MEVDTTWALFVGGGPWQGQWHPLRELYPNYFVLWPAPLPRYLPSIEEPEATEEVDLPPRAEYRLDPVQPPANLGVSRFYIAACVEGCEDPYA